MRLPTHSTSQANRCHAGFTLVELMVVVAIVAVVISLGASATMQVIPRQKTANTELSLVADRAGTSQEWGCEF